MSEFPITELVIIYALYMTYRHLRIQSGLERITKGLEVLQKATNDRLRDLHSEFVPIVTEINLRDFVVETSPLISLPVLRSHVVNCVSIDLWAGLYLTINEDKPNTYNYQTPKMFLIDPDKPNSVINQFSSKYNVSYEEFMEVAKDICGDKDEQKLHITTLTCIFPPERAVVDKVFVSMALLDKIITYIYNKKEQTLANALPASMF